ncbi:LURP-one-related/scramblase family protein [Lapidilactobacillus bayanensis]|uniref:hypothetical protein n=1 Tax=Lapidilactobacillus bayanensis TaxID=2485998 RepID=UPI000F797B6D|nr:hypothetical protein [Lapidilactobacillus bayanensis]
MAVYYLLNQNPNGVNSQFIFDEDYQPIMILTGQFDISQGSLNLLSINGNYLGRVTQIKSKFSPTYQLEARHNPIGQMHKLTAVWHQFTYISQLNWTVMGSLATNSYQTAHGIRNIFTVQPMVNKKGLDGIMITLEVQQQDLIPVFLVAATLNQWSLIAQRKTKLKFNPYHNIATN